MIIVGINFQEVAKIYTTFQVSYTKVCTKYHCAIVCGKQPLNGGNTTKFTKVFTSKNVLLSKHVAH